jgi:precorrin-6B C5,15-methyltransferase / cobalt-precorrin-6B C5,C15-methyltransferase
MMTEQRPWLSVVGIGEDGFAGLGEGARAALAAAKAVYGGARHLEMVPEQPGQERIVWPRPLSSAYEGLLARRGTPVCVLASGDPMFYGIGATLARLVPPEEMAVWSAPSSLSLAAARLKWPLASCVCVTVHGRPLSLVHPHIHPGAKLLVLSDDGRTPAALAALLAARGFGPSRLHVFEHLGGGQERHLAGTAETWEIAETADLNVVAVDCAAAESAHALSTLAGLPDEAFLHDGQLTKRDLRAVTLSRLAPSPGELLWDVGAGCGSIGIEWMRSHPACRAVAVEADAGRRAMIEHNRDALGVPGLRIVAGRAPEALEGLEEPDAVFVGGGVTVPGLLERVWANLRPGGRLVANAVTVQSEGALAGWKARMGGELTRIAVQHAEPLGRFDTWRPALPVTILCSFKPRG